MYSWAIKGKSGILFFITLHCNVLICFYMIVLTVVAYNIITFQEHKEVITYIKQFYNFILN